MKLRCIQHVPFEPPGNIISWAKEKRHVLEMVKVYDAPIPTDDDFDALILLGGPMSVHDVDENPWLINEFDLVRRTIDNSKPVLGICLGGQIIAKVLGAEVKGMGYREIGFYTVCLADGAISGSKAFSGLPRCFLAFHWHGEEFSLPERAKLLAETDACKVQGFEFQENVLALQFHLETNSGNLFALIANSREDLLEGGKYVQRLEYMHDTLDRFAYQSYQTMSAVLDNWLRGNDSD